MRIDELSTPIDALRDIVEGWFHELFHVRAEHFRVTDGRTKEKAKKTWANNKKTTTAHCGLTAAINSMQRTNFEFNGPVGPFAAA